MRDARLDGHDSEILVLQSAGPFASSSDLTAAETSLQSAIDAILAQLAALTTGGGTNLINAQAWPGEITWDWLVGTNQIRNLHATAPLSVSVQNDNFTLSLACDAYSIAQADAAIAAAIAAALLPYETAAQRDAAIAAALAAFSTTVEVDGLIAAALADYSTIAGVNGLITTALADYSTTARVNGLIATAVGGIDLSNYYERAETYSQTEVNSVVSGAIDSLNITQYRTESQVSSSISDALVPYYTASEVDAAIASNSFNAADYFTRTQSDSRYFPNNANPGNAEVFTLVRDSVSIARQIRGILPRAPLAWSYLFSGTITELRCDAYSKAPTRPQASRSWKWRPGNCTLNVPGQEIWLIVETNGIVTTAYGQNDLSDEKVKQNVRDADLEELQAIFDQGCAEALLTGRTWTKRTGWAFWLRTCSTAASPAKTMWGGKELLTLDYGKLTAVLWGVCKKLQARVEALEKPKKPKTRRGESPRER